MTRLCVTDVTYEQGNAKWYCIFLLLVLPVFSIAQTASKKEINQQYQFWGSINSVIRFNEHWGVLADFHVRRNNFLADPSFYLVRGAANYWIKPNMTVALGYGHMWMAPAEDDWHTWSNENRIYQQFQVNTKSGRASVLQRLRNEQRWKQEIENDVPTGEYNFTDRIRYLFSFNYAVFQNNYLPSLVIADEILLQFGKQVVYNTLDQNRLFLGIKQNINTRLNFDFGYMNVFQQKSSGYQYDMNHTMRLFFYYNVGWRQDKEPAAHESGEE